VLATLAVKLLIAPLVTWDEPGLLFLAAIMLAAVWGGLGPGLLATVLGAIFDGFFFMKPFRQFALASTDEAIRLIVFALEGAFVSVVCARLKEARHQAEISAAEAQELEGALVRVSEAEQSRIGRDLHDGLSQHLTGIGLLAKRLQEVLQQSSSPAEQDALRLCDLSKTAVTLSRDLCRSLLPPTLEIDGIAEALDELAVRTEQLFGVECEYHLTGESRRLDLQRSVHLYRITQEAVNNSIRHGQAKRIDIRLEFTDRTATLVVTDNGKGIPPGLDPIEGLGLRIMRYRARILGSQLQLTTAPDKGVIVRCEVSLDPTEIEKGSHGSANPIASVA